MYGDIKTWIEKEIKKKKKDIEPRYGLQSFPSFFLQ